MDQAWQGTANTNSNNKATNHDNSRGLRDNKDMTALRIDGKNIDCNNRDKDRKE